METSISSNLINQNNKPDINILQDKKKRTIILTDVDTQKKYNKFINNKIRTTK
jgi:hypothetical protein